MADYINSLCVNKLTCLYLFYFVILQPYVHESRLEHAMRTVTGYVRCNLSACGQATNWFYLDGKALTFSQWLIILISIFM